jgi:hypothetical protein
LRPFIEAFFPHDIMRRRADERQGSGQEAVAAPTRPRGGGAGDGHGEQKPTGLIAVEEQRSAASCRCKKTQMPQNIPRT